jgi:hypothetical protein
MKLPSFIRLSYSDFPSQFQTLVDQLSYTINNGFDGLYQALSNGLTLRDNLAATIKDVTISVDATGKPQSTAAFTVANTTTIEGTQVIRAINGSNNNLYPTGGIFISYTQTGNKISIDNVAGLPASTSFTLRVVAYLGS